MRLPLGFGGIVEGLRRSTVVLSGHRGGMGSGVIVDPEGAIVTNDHVVRSAQVDVQLWDGRTFRAEIKARDSGRDLALLSVPASGLPAAPMGDSNTLRVGQLVVAVGNPLGFIGAVTTGVVHAVGPLAGMGSSPWVQSDLQLAPGNSGGILADAMGQLVGINSMISGQLALAIPGNVVRRFIASQQPGESLGVVLRPVPLARNGVRQLGLLLLQVADGGCAHAASLLPGDIIVGIEGRSVQSFEDLERAMEGRGERVLHLQFVRGERTTLRTTSVLLGVGRSRAA
jgi:serine protease Do